MAKSPHNQPEYVIGMVSRASDYEKNARFFKLSRKASPTYPRNMRESNDTYGETRIRRLRFVDFTLLKSVANLPALCSSSGALSRATLRSLDSESGVCKVPPNLSPKAESPVL